MMLHRLVDSFGGLICTCLGKQGETFEEAAANAADARIGCIYTLVSTSRFIKGNELPDDLL